MSSDSAVQPQSDSLIVYPETEEEVAKVLAFASAHQLGVVPRGGGSQSELGAPVKRQDLILSLSRMNQILDYSPADLTVTVQAGTTLRALQAVLQQSGQWLALDPPLGEAATIGGLISTNASGPRRLLYGALRDQVIGMRVAYPDGTVIKTGGKVVKNVAGYDMGKLFIGALGTLGVITEATFKLRPLPSEQEIVLVRPTSFEEAQRMQREVLDSELIPSCLELLNPSLAVRLGQPEAWTLAIGCDEGQQGAFYQRERLREIARLERFEKMDVLQGAEAQGFWQAYGEAWSGQGVHTEQTVQKVQAKVSLLPMQVVPFVRDVQEQSAMKHVAVEISASLGTGLVSLHADLTGTTESAWPALLSKWRQIAEDSGGALVLVRAPQWLKEQIGVWGRERGEFALMRGIKQTIDPQSILNAGRFVGGM